RPHRDVQLRGSGATWAILAVDQKTGGGRTIGTLDGVRAFHEGHPGAVYLHAGRQYLVDELDHQRRRVLATAADLDHYTTPLVEKETTVLEVLAERRPGPLQAWLGRVRVPARVVGYERKRLDGRDTLSRHTLDLPALVFETVALWWAAPAAVAATLAGEGRDFMGALHAAEHAAIALLPRVALCDRGDVGGISIPVHPQVGCGAVFVSDGHPGGVGIAAAGFARLEALLADVAGMIAACPCEGGCPSCIQSPKCGNGNRPLDKAGAVLLLRLLLGDAQPVDAWGEPVDMRLDAAPRGGAPRGFAPRGFAPRGATTSDDTAENDCGSAGTAGALPVVARWPRVRSLLRSPARWLRRRLVGASVEGSGHGTVLFDLETRRSAAEVGGWGNAHRMGVAVAVVCHLEEGRFESYGEERVGELVAALAAARLVVGFNVRRFDYRVLSGYTGIDHGRQLPTLDLLDDLFGRLGFRIGLGHLAEATLGVGKSADGLQSLAWVREGRLDLVEGYCRRDVEVMRDLYLHGRREGWICYDDRRRGARLRVRVAW
ncbi:MAG TPA: Zn-binding domain-containing protein, partial [Thermoanaerobaculia bacterium]|nr:Zn-binding domain-containing protein [Thermoanaerobaculia bacterium]